MARVKWVRARWVYRVGRGMAFSTLEVIRRCPRLVLVGLVGFIVSAAWPLVVALLWVATSQQVPLVNVRWAPDLSTGQRAAIERDLDLVPFAPREPPTWTYFVLDDSRAGLRAIVANPFVDDTAFIDRRASALDEPPSAPYWIVNRWPGLSNPYLLYVSLLGCLLSASLLATAIAGRVGRSWSPSDAPPRWQHGALVALVALTLVLIWTRNDALNDGTSFKYAPASEIAKSQLLMDVPRDYTGYAAISRVPMELSASEVEEWRVQLAQLSGYEDDMRFETNDKGVVDFVRWAYQLFGMNNRSLLELWFVFLSLGLLIYVIDHHADSGALLLVLLFTLALYATVFIIPLSDQLNNIHDPRFFGVLALVPLLHVIVATLNNRLTIRSALCVAGQVALIVVVLHARSSAQWLIVCAFAVSGLLIMTDLTTRTSEGGLAKLRRVARNRAWPAVVLFGGLVALGLYKQATYHPAYFESGPYPDRRVMWHNVFMGFTVHPELSQQYRLPIVSDSVVYEAAERYLIRGDDRSQWEDVFEAEYREGGAEGLNWSKYDLVVREMFFEVLRAHPLQAVATFAYYKPRLLLRQFQWAMGRRPTDENDLFLHGHGVATDGQRERGNQYFRLFRLESLMILLMAVALSNSAGLARSGRLLFVAGSVALMSLAPAFATYPVIHVMGDVFVTVALLGYMLIALLVLVIYDTWSTGSTRRPWRH